MGKGGTQQRLNALAETPAFRNILEEEIDKRKLVPKDVERCILNLYHEVSKHAHGNTMQIEINKRLFTPDELCALVSFFRLQGKWCYPLDWLEIDREAT